MRKEDRTKSYKRCQAEALLMGAQYDILEHAYYIELPSGNLDKIVCAETLRPVSASEARLRVMQYLGVRGKGDVN